MKVHGYKMGCEHWLKFERKKIGFITVGNSEFDNN